MLLSFCVHLLDARREKTKQQLRSGHDFDFVVCLVVNFVGILVALGFVVVYVYSTVHDSLARSVKAELGVCKRKSYISI